MTKLYRARANLRAIDELRNIVHAAVLSVAALVGVAFLVDFDELSRFWVATLFVGVVVAMTVERRMARHVFRRLRRTRRVARRVLIVGCDAQALDLARRLSASPSLGYEPVGFIGDDAVDGPEGTCTLGTLDQVESVAEAHDTNGVIISLNSISEATINRVTRRLTDGGLHVTLSSSLRDIEVRRVRPYEVDGQAMLYIEPTIRTGWRVGAKWLFDKTIAVVGLLVALPVLTVAAVAIKATSHGPVLFRQSRVGRHGVPFEMLKLRTMVADAEARKHELLEANESDGPLFKISTDPRITRVGRTLRKLSIDELPQFWNVLRGDMSIVGPRPALGDEVEQWSGDVFERLRVLPGITGMWQVSGRADTSFEQYKRLDLYYVDNWSPVHDLRIVVQTIWVVVSCRGAR